MTTGTGRGWVNQFQLQTLTMGIPLFRAATLLPQTAVIAIFHIVGGKVLLTSILGECTVIWGAVPGNTLLNENPTAGTTEIIGTATVYANLPAGDCIGLDGLDGTAVLPAAAGNTPGMGTMGRVLRIGDLEWEQTGNATGQMSWAITYIPLDDGAYMTVG